jgi:hypothetical protein
MRATIDWPATETATDGVEGLDLSAQFPTIPSQPARGDPSALVRSRARHAGPRSYHIDARPIPRVPSDCLVQIGGRDYLYGQ